MRGDGERHSRVNATIASTRGSIRCTAGDGCSASVGNLLLYGYLGTLYLC